VIGGSGVGLLVSVRSLEEARAAVEGGCTVLDVKEPTRGPLGMADPDVVRDVVRYGADRGVVCSMALGEVVEWADRRVSDWEPLGIDFAKLGLSGVSGVSDTAVADDSWDWRANWCGLRERLVGPRQWIAVAYADGAQCGAPELDDVVTAAIETGCAGVLIDTWDKTGGSLTDWLSCSRLRAVRESTDEAGLLLALAGKVSLKNLAEVMDVRPDLVAVRGAVCREGRRESHVEAKLVGRLVSELADRMNGEVVSARAARHAG
jgi:uncharacterized protein (UPF0264 family)